MRLSADDLSKSRTTQKMQKGKSDLQTAAGYCRRADSADRREGTFQFTLTLIVVAYV